MQRYLKLIIIVAAIIIIPVFYIQLEVAENGYPEFVIKRVSGDETEVANLTLYAHHMEGLGRLHGDSLTIGTEGSVYYGERSFWEQLESNYINPELKQLQEEYRSFMRGKALDEALFYEDENKVIYAGDNSNYYYQRGENKLTVSVLDKQSKEEIEMNFPVPDDYDRVYVNGIRFQNDKLFIITNNFPYQHWTGNMSFEEMHVYEVDLSSGQLVSDQIVAEHSSKPNREVGYRQLIKSTNNSGNRIAIWIQTEDEEMEPVEDELVLYNLGTGEEEILTLPENLQYALHDTVIDGDTLYLNQITPQGLEVTAFHLEEKEINSQIVLDLPKHESSELGEFPHMEIKNGKMYLAASLAGAVFVLDLETEQLLYEGKLIIDNASPDRKESYLQIYDMNI